MLYLGTQSTVEPEKVIVEILPDGECIVRLADHVKVVEDEGFDGEPSSHYEYDEVVFNLPDDRTDTAEEIEEEFDAWWLYGQDDEEESTLEQRLSDLEDIVFGLIVGENE